MDEHQVETGDEGEDPREQQPFSSPMDLLNLIDTISYFFHLKMHVMEKHVTFNVPREVDRIIELARDLPTPRPDEWGSLAVGRISTKRKFGVHGMEESSKAIKGIKRRVAWTSESNRELVELVENDDLRQQRIFDGSNHDGSINWMGLARKFGFSSPEPVQRQYQLLMEKKAVRELDHEKSTDLIRLVQNASYRERILGTQEVVWHAIAAHLGVTEESARDKYREMTGAE